MSGFLYYLQTVPLTYICKFDKEQLTLTQIKPIIISWVLLPGKCQKI